MYASVEENAETIYIVYGQASMYHQTYLDYVAGGWFPRENITITPSRIEFLKSKQIILTAQTT